MRGYFGNLELGHELHKSTDGDKMALPRPCRTEMMDSVHVRLSELNKSFGEWNLWEAQATYYKVKTLPDHYMGSWRTRKLEKEVTPQLSYVWGVARIIEMQGSEYVRVRRWWARKHASILLPNDAHHHRHYALPKTISVQMMTSSKSSVKPSH